MTTTQKTEIKPETKTEIDTDMLDFADLPSPHLRAMVIRLRIEMLTAAKALRGELLDEIWKLVDELNALRAAQARDRSTP